MSRGEKRKKERKEKCREGWIRFRVGVFINVILVFGNGEYIFFLIGFFVEEYLFVKGKV